MSRSFSFNLNKAGVSDFKREAYTHLCIVFELAM